jgi:phytoene dehydrogenase-like protein
MARHTAIVAFARFNEPSLSIGTIYKKREPFRRCARLRDTSTVAYVEKLKRFRYGPCAFKIDYAVSCPIPWTASECSRAATVHIGGSLEGIIEAERTLDSERVFVLHGQPFLFDSTRAPTGGHIAWAYCHVPNGSTIGYTEAIENQISRFAPGFRDCILARSVSTPSALEQWNPNLVGRDILGSP